MFAQNVSHDGHHHDGRQRARHTLRDARRKHDQGDAHEAHHDGRPRDGRDAFGVHHPFGEEVARHVIDRQPEQVFDLRGEDGQGDAARETDDDGVRDELDDRPEAHQAHEQQ